MDEASLGKGAWPFSAEMAKPEVPINLPTDTISAVRNRGLRVGAQEITELSVAQSHPQASDGEGKGWGGWGWGLFPLTYS